MNTQVTPQATVAHEMELVSQLSGAAATEIIYHDNGWDSRAYSIGGQYFFKFPRSDKIQGRYAGEIAALSLVAGLHTAIATPQVRWQHPDNAYFGYKGVPGKPLGQLNLPSQEKQRVGTLLGQFIQALHNVTLPTARQVPIVQEIRQLHEWYQPSAALVATRWTPAEQQRLGQLVATQWPEDMLRLGSTPTLSHADLNLSNIFYDKGNLGVIDFGDVAYYDHSKDFTRLDEPVIFEAAIAAYGDTPKLREKIALRRNVATVIALTAAIGKQDHQRTEEVLTQLHAAL